MAEWKRRTNWAWPDWTYFFGSIVIVPVIDLGLGSPLRFLNDPGSSRYGRASWVIEFMVVLIALNRLDPIGRLLKIPGDAPTSASMPVSTQAAVCLWLGALLGVLGIAGGLWVRHRAVAPGANFSFEDHESVFFLIFMALLFSFVCLLTGSIMRHRARREQLQQDQVAAR